jgi:hypothetical protein
MKGLGDKVTDRFVDMCLKEASAFPNLKELHFFAPKVSMMHNMNKETLFIVLLYNFQVTEKAIETIRRNYAVRSGFILDMESNLE